MDIAFVTALPALQTRQWRGRRCARRVAMVAPSIRVGDAGALAAEYVLKFSPATVAVSGGSLPRLLAAGLSGKNAMDAVKQWKHVILADERVVALDHEDSNYRSVVEHLGCEVVAINPTLDANACAEDYEKKVMDKMGDSIDLVLLGLGPDGHTCSLFEGHKLLGETEKFIAPITDSPKLPPVRVTLTLGALAKAKHVLFVVTGESKAAVVKDILENADSTYPGALVRPTSGSVVWCLDNAAASELSNQ